MNVGLKCRNHGHVTVNVMALRVIATITRRSRLWLKTIDDGLPPEPAVKLCRVGVKQVEAMMDQACANVVDAHLVPRPANTLTTIVFTRGPSKATSELSACFRASRQGSSGADEAIQACISSARHMVKPLRHSMNRS